MQRKLAVGRVDDPLEREADRVADLVTQTPAPEVSAAAPSPRLSRKCHACDEAEARSVQPKASDRPNAVEREAPAIVHDVLRQPGQRLDRAAREALESRFGRSLGDIRIHADSAAADSARAVGALAYTVGRHVVFGTAQYAPTTPSGRRLLAHELVHTFQQGGAALRRQAAEPADKDVDREKILAAAGRSQNPLQSRAWEVVWRMLTRYFPEYAPLIAGVGYEEGEPAVRVAVEKTKSGGEQVRSATVIVGKAFVEHTSDDSLRERIEQLGLSLELSGLKPITDPAAPAPTVVWKMIHDSFPAKARRLAGTSYDANLPGLRTEFGAGSVKVGSTTKAWSGPLLYFGKAFLALDPPAQNAALKVELAKVDEWSVETGHLVAGDLKDDDITLRIRGLTTAQLVELSSKIADPTVKTYMANLARTSTPTPSGATTQPDGSMTLMIGAVTVVIAPDVSGDPGVDSGEGETGFAFDVSRIRFETIKSTAKDERITSFTAPAVTITIRTRYARDAGPDAPSGYGRGTTERDKALKATTLRVHEGAHGEDYLQFLREHPYPTFAGKVGDTRKDFTDKINKFKAAQKAFCEQATAFSNKQTHEVGFTIEEFDRENPGQTPARMTCD